MRRRGEEAWVGGSREEEDNDKDRPQRGGEEMGEEKEEP